MLTEYSVCLSPKKAITLSGKMSLLALIAGMSAGCSMVPLREPIFTGSTPNQQQIITGQAGSSPTGYQSAPGGGVQSADLAPPPGNAAAPSYAAAPAYATPAPRPYTPPKPYAAAGLPRPVGQVATTANAAPLQLGAPPTTLGEQAARVGGPGAGQGTSAGSHTVQPGDTMWNISQRYHVSVNQLIAANGDSTNIKLGQRLVIPGGSAAPPNTQVAAVDPKAITIPAANAAPAPPPLTMTPVTAAPTPIQPPTQELALAPQTGAAGAAAPAAPQASVATGGFRWPVRGRIISSFGKRPNGERNDGINLAVPEGTAVKAAEDGTVIYAGNELKSYGNLVLIRHAGGWVSAYAHNSELKVKRGEQVQRGQVIALSGMTGGVTTPQVHFELRQEATPVDPIQHLSET